MKTCLICEDELVVGENWLESSKASYLYKCRPCKNKEEREKRDTRTSETRVEKHERLKNLSWYTGNYTPRDGMLMFNFGIRERDFNAILKSQGGGCAICGKPEGDTHHHVDHDHSKDYMDIRGILCGTCNQGIGLMKDSAELMTKGAKYLGGSYVS